MAGAEPNLKAGPFLWFVSALSKSRRLLEKFKRGSILLFGERGRGQVFVSVAFDLPQPPRFGFRGVTQLARQFNSFTSSCSRKKYPLAQFIRSHSLFPR